MAKLVWDETSKRLYETGVNQCALYLKSETSTYENGVAWNGITAITESPSGGEPSPQYADNIKYINLMSAEELGATIEAYTYPDEFAECDGSAEIAEGVTIGQQRRKTFGLCYKTILGNDVSGEDHGYKLHLLYGCLAAPSEKGYSTINDSPEAITFSWEITTTPVSVNGKKPTASIAIDSTKVDTTALAALETILYGGESVEPRLPLPDEVRSIFTSEEPVTLELVSIVPEDDDTEVEINASIVLTFSNKIVSEAVSITSNLGIIVTGTKVWDAAGKVLTFTPTTALENDTVYLVAIAGVADIYGQSLTTTIKNFSTIA